MDLENRLKTLDALFSEHQRLYELFKNDATVYSWLKMYEIGECTLDEALVGIIVVLATEKQKLFNEIVEIKSKRSSLGISPPPGEIGPV